MTRADKFRSSVCWNIRRLRFCGQRCDNINVFNRRRHHLHDFRKNKIPDQIDSDSDSEEPAPPPSARSASEACSILRQFFQTIDTPQTIFDEIAQIENKVMKARDTVMKQSHIQDFFSKH